MAAIAAIGDYARGSRRSGTHLRHDDAEGVAVIGVARQRLHMGDELAAARMMKVVATETLTPNS